MAEPKVESEPDRRLRSEARADRPLDVSQLAGMLRITRVLPVRLRYRAIAALLWWLGLVKRPALERVFVDGSIRLGIPLEESRKQGAAREFARFQSRKLALLAVFATLGERDLRTTVTTESWASSAEALKEALGRDSGVIVLSPHVGLSVLVPFFLQAELDTRILAMGDRKGIAAGRRRLKALGVSPRLKPVETLGLPDPWAAVKISQALRRRQIVFIMPDVTAGVASESAISRADNGLDIASRAVARLSVERSAPVICSYLVEERQHRWAWLSEVVVLPEVDKAHGPRLGPKARREAVNASTAALSATIANVLAGRVQRFQTQASTTLLLGNTDLPRRERLRRGARRGRPDSSPETPSVLTS